jgi:hypothetical protein
MTGKVFQSSAANPLILILPLALVIIILLTAWPLLLILTIGSLIWRVWENHQWKQWTEIVNPYFYDLIHENQGCLTPLDLSAKANLTSKAAKRFLDKKAQEYGAQHKIYDDKGIVYYFLTASAFGSILEDSEPPLEIETEAVEIKDSFEVARAYSGLKDLFAEEDDFHEASVNEIAQLVELENSQTSSETTVENNSPISTSNLKPLCLIQSELAKRLDLHPSTIAKRRSDADFPEWSQSKDPEGIAWTYLRKDKLFIPLKDQKRS